MWKFKAPLNIIGINPFVFVPARILEKIFIQAGKSTGAVPVHGTINKQPYKQTLVRYSGEWRLYINTTMLKDSPKRVGEIITMTIEHDVADRTVPMHPGLAKALQKNTKAKNVFDVLSPSRQKEINRYLFSLKTEESVNKNIIKAIDFLNGKTRFAGRDKP